MRVAGLPDGWRDDEEQVEAERARQLAIPIPRVTIVVDSPNSSAFLEEDDPDSLAAGIVAFSEARLAAGSVEMSEASSSTDLPPQ